EAPPRVEARRGRPPQQITTTGTPPGTPGFAIHPADPHPAAIALADLRELGKKIIADVSAETLRPILSTDLIGEFERVRALPHNRREPTTAPVRPGFNAPARSVTTAVAVSTAIPVLLNQPESQR